MEVVKETSTWNEIYSIIFNNISGSFSSNFLFGYYAFFVEKTIRAIIVNRHGMRQRKWESLENLMVRSSINVGSN